VTEGCGFAVRDEPLGEVRLVGRADVIGQDDEHAFAQPKCAGAHDDIVEGRDRMLQFREPHAASLQDVAAILHELAIPTNTPAWGSDAP